MSDRQLTMAWLALSIQQRIGMKTMRALLAHFGSPEAVIAASVTDLKKVPGVGAKIAAAIHTIDLSRITQNFETWQHNGVCVYAPDDPAYPATLKRLEDAPPVLFIRGVHDNALYQRTVAIIGTRRPSTQAAETAFKLASYLAEQGYTIVSGLATGIDSAAHRGALAVDGGQTIAVLGSGVLSIYPAENYDLAQQTMVRGCLVSEVAPDATPNAARLIARNRLITGLSGTIFVIETAIDGGAMHAVRFARHQGRSIYAGSFPASGNLQLLRDGVRTIPTDFTKINL